MSDFKGAAFNSFGGGGAGREAGRKGKFSEGTRMSQWRTQRRWRWCRRGIGSWHKKENNGEETQASGTFLFSFNCSLQLIQKWYFVKR